MEQQITDDGWIPVKHVLHIDLLLAAFIIPIQNQNQDQFFEFVAKYLKEAQLPFIQTIYDYFIHEKQLIVIVRRPQITLNDFLCKFELTDNQIQLAAYSISMGLFMAHKHKLYVGQFNFRDILIFEDQYICLSVVNFFQLPCSCWTSQQELVNLYQNSIMLLYSDNQQYIPQLNQKCDCGRQSYDLGQLKSIQNLLYSQFETQSVRQLCQIILQEMNWPKIMLKSFLHNARISPNVDNTRYYFDDQPCQFNQPKNRHKKLDNQYTKQNSSGIVLQTGIRNRNQSIIPQNLLPYANKIAQNIQEEESIILSILDPSYVVTKEDSLDQTQLTQNLNIQDKNLSLFLQNYKHTDRKPESLLQENQNNIQSDHEATDAIVLLQDTKINLVKQLLLDELKSDKPNLVKLFLMLRILLVHLPLQQKMNDQPFPLDILFISFANKQENLVFPQQLLKITIDDCNYLNTITTSFVDIISQYEENYQLTVKSYIGSIFELQLQLFYLQSVQNIPIQLLPPQTNEGEFISVDNFTQLITPPTDQADSLIKKLFQFLEITKPDLFEISSQETLDSQQILSFIDINSSFNRFQYINLANIINYIIDIIFAFQCHFIVENRIIVDDINFTRLFNFKSKLSNKQNKNDSLHDQLFFFHIGFLIAFQLILASVDVGLQLLNNLLRPRIFGLFSSQFATYFCQQQLFCQNYQPLVESIGKENELFDQILLLKQNVSTFCNCSTSKFICSNCKALNQKLIVQKDGVQSGIFDCFSAQYVTELGWNLIVDCKRYFLPILFSDLQVSGILTVMLQINSQHIIGQKDVLFELSSKNNIIYKFINELSQEQFTIGNMQLLNSILQDCAWNMDLLFVGPFLQKVLAFIFHSQENNLAILNTYEALRLASLLLSQLNHQVVIFIQQCNQNSLDQLMKIYINVDFNDYQQIVQNILFITPDLIKLMNQFNDTFVQYVTQLLNQSPNKFQSTSIFNSQQKGFLESSCLFCLNIIDFSANYNKLQQLQQNIVTDNKQLLSSISIQHTEILNLCDRNIKIEFILQLLILQLQNQYILQFGLSFQILKQVVQVGIIHKLDIQFLTKLLDIDYMQQLLLFYNFEEVQKFFINVYLAIRNITIEQLKKCNKQSTDKSQLSILSQSMSIQQYNSKTIKPPSAVSRINQFGNSLHASFSKSTIEVEGASLQLTLDQKLYNFIVISSEKLGKIMIDCLVAFLSEQCYISEFILDEDIKPLMLIQQVISQYICIYKLNKRLPSLDFIKDLTCYLLVNIQQQKIIIRDIDLNFIDFIFQEQLPVFLIKSLMYVLKDLIVSKESEFLIIFGERIISLYLKPELQPYCLSLFFNALKACEDLHIEQIKNMISSFYEVNCKKFNKYTDEQLHDILQIMIFLFEKGYFHGFSSSKLPLELLQTINMRSRQQIKDMFIKIFNLAKDDIETKQVFQSLSISTYLQQTKLEPYQKVQVKQLMTDYKK